MAVTFAASYLRKGKINITIKFICCDYACVGWKTRIYKVTDNTSMTTLERWLHSEFPYSYYWQVVYYQYIETCLFYQFYWYI